MDNSHGRSTYLSVIVPAYNEEDRIELTLRSIHAYLFQQTYPFEVIVVNDGSKDRTSQVVSRLISEFPYIRLIDNKDNRGKGWAVKQGMLSAKGEIRLFMDADNSTSIDQLERMIPYFEKDFDVVIGSRRISGAVISVHQSWIRENVGRAVNWLTRTIDRIPMQDTQAGFKAFSSTAAQKVFPLQTIWRWIFDVELLVICRRLGLRVKEVPIVWKNDERSNVRLRHTIDTLRDIIKIRLNEMYGVYSQTKS